MRLCWDSCWFEGNEFLFLIQWVSNKVSLWTSVAPDVSQWDFVETHVDLRAMSLDVLNSTWVSTESHCEHLLHLMSQMRPCWKLSWFEGKWVFVLNSTESPTKSHCEHLLLLMSQMRLCWKLSWFEGNESLFLIQLSLLSLLWHSLHLNIRCNSVTKDSGDVRNWEQWVSLFLKTTDSPTKCSLWTSDAPDVTNETQLETQLN